MEWIDRLLPSHDVLLVEGHKDTPLPRVWLDQDGAPSPGGASAYLEVLPKGADRVERVWNLLMGRLKAASRSEAILGCLLVGGRSTRMGRPKQLLERNGKTWAEDTVRRLRAVAKAVILSGDGSVAPALATLPRLPDVPGVQGPLGGLLSVLRWNPRSGWLAVPCDMPDLTEGALQWLLEQRRPGTWAVMADLGESGGIQPFPVFLDFRIRPVLEALAREGRFSLQHLARHPRTRVVPLPSRLRSEWQNLNTPRDLDP